jgi:hypothetical protein
MKSFLSFALVVLLAAFSIAAQTTTTTTTLPAAPVAVATPAPLSPGIVVPGATSSSPIAIGGFLSPATNCKACLGTSFRFGAEQVLFSAGRLADLRPVISGCTFSFLEDHPSCRLPRLLGWWTARLAPVPRWLW